MKEDKSEEIRAVIKTLAYADVFDYPLTLDQVHRFLIAFSALNKQSVYRLLQQLYQTIKRNNRYYYFAHRTTIIEKRLQREKESKKKLITAIKMASFLRLIPTVQLIAVSGALAMKNVDAKDDIDFFIITKAQRLWITRMLALLLLQVFGKRRRHGQREFSDTICVNMLLSERALRFSKNYQNLYTAHEIIQIQPLFDRGNTYVKFINANRWVKKYLPNALVRRKTTRIHTQNYAQTIFSTALQIVMRFSALEIFAKQIQIWYMKRHRTTETITDVLLAFHPVNYHKKIMHEYKKRVKQYVQI